MRISDWSSDVCSSDLTKDEQFMADGEFDWLPGAGGAAWTLCEAAPCDACVTRDRKSVVSGKSVSVRVDLGGRRIIKNKNKIIHCDNSSQTNNIYIFLNIHRY